MCNNAGIGAGAEGAWEHELNDWRWAINVNLYGVIHGINAFVPAMVAGGDEGHVVNTSSGNGGVSPLRGTPQYAVTKAAVVTLTECLYAQLRRRLAGRGLGAVPRAPHAAHRAVHLVAHTARPAWPRNVPRSTPYPTVEDIEAQMAAAGIDAHYTEPAEVADQVVEAVRPDLLDPGAERAHRRTRSGPGPTPWSPGPTRLPPGGPRMTCGRSRPPT